MNENRCYTKYDSKYDIIKFVLSLFVVAIHANLYPLILYPWLRIAVPMFFIMSSYFFFSSLQNITYENHRKILKKFVFRNIHLYICWFAILLPITLLKRKNLYFEHGVLGGIQNFLKGLFFGSTFIASWFIPATVFGVLIIYYLSKWLKRGWLVLIISFLFFGAVTLKSSYSVCIAGAFLENMFNIYEKIFGNIACSFPAAVVWVFVGKAFAESERRFFPIWLLIGSLIVSCIGLYCEWIYVVRLAGFYNNDSYFMLLPVCCLLFAIIQRIPPMHWMPSIHLRHASTVIYVVHGSLIPIWRFFLERILGFTKALPVFCITFASCLILTVVIDFAKNKHSQKKISEFLRFLY